MTASPLQLLPPKNDAMRVWAVVLMALAPLAFGCLALLLGADASWDLRNYHWYNAWAYLAGRPQTDFMPSQGQFFLNPWLDVPFYSIASHVPLKAAFFILGAVQGLNFPLLLMIAWMTLNIRDSRRKLAACAGLALMGILSAVGISEIGTVFYDNITSLGVLLSLLLLLRRLEGLQKAPGRDAAFYAGLCGLPAGVMAGLKLTCATYSVGLCLALLVFTPQARRCFLLSLCFGLGVLAGFTLTYGHWGWHLATHYGSPTFPFFNIIFRSPLLPKDSLLLDFAPPHNWRLLVYPFLFGADPKLVNEIWWQDWRIPALYALSLWLIVQYKLTKERARGDAVAAAAPARFLLLTAGVSYYCWLLSETVYRYLLTLDMLAPLLLFICIGMLPLERRARLVTATAVLAALALTLQPGDWGRHGRWPEQMTDVSLPPLPAGNKMILMAGVDAYAYLLPAFPPEVEFVRIESRGFPPDAGYGVTELIRRKVKDHKGPLMLLIPAREIEAGNNALRAFHLTLLTESCRAVTDNLSEPRLDKPQDMGNAYPKAYSLCNLGRLKGNSSLRSE